MWEKTLGQIAYEAWGEAEEKRGRRWPFWQILTDAERASWGAAGAAVRQAVNADRDPRSRP